MLGASGNICKASEWPWLGWTRGHLDASSTGRTVEDLISDANNASDRIFKGSNRDGSSIKLSGAGLFTVSTH